MCLNEENQKTLLSNLHDKRFTLKIYNSHYPTEQRKANEMLMTEAVSR